MKISFKTLLSFVFLFSFSFSLTSSATVSQVDGTIVPIYANCEVWAAVNYGEGYISDLSGTNHCSKTCTGGDNCINAQADADIYPQIFKPMYGGGQLVTFTDLMEQAGFENTFGWYNVGTPSVRYPIFNCSDEPVNTVSIDFGDELLAGRYSGGYIGFYIITPEDSPSSVNCGSDNSDSGGSQFGHIYYSESALNGDGDYVHNLVYTSKTEPTRFYFAFEDLFRGGDNDFSDYVIKVEGLTPPCIPHPEVCDGLDNDCDGLIDENTVDSGGTCGSDTGECEFGTIECINGILTCTGGTDPTPEVCDGLDNDCNGNTDDNPVDTGDTCGSDTGECSTGVTICAGGVLVCSGDTKPSVEVCDGLDNDCDGTADNNLTDVGALCGSNTGECEFGTTQCVNGSIVCSGGIGPASEVCDGLDNDCNGYIDDNLTDTGFPCGITEGQCQTGLTVCNAGHLECDGSIGPTDEVCDGLDNNCNGDIDENNPGGGGECGPQAVGQCKPGVWLCMGGHLVCDGAVFAGIEICDGEDNDCDGNIDNDAECPGGGECVNGNCLLPCNGEFCPSGMDCIDNLCIPNLCYGINCEESENCVDGECINRCDLYPCDDGFKCDRNRGICIEDNCYGYGCPDGEICKNAVCTTDPCKDITCNNGEFCRDGSCVKSCAGIVCEEGKHCIDGTCKPNPCFETNCKNGEICENGECKQDLCLTVICGKDRICKNGICTDDPCAYIHCSEGICRNGQCEDENPISTPPSEKITSGGGCSSSSNSTSDLLSVFIILAVFYLIRIFRKNNHLILLLILLGIITTSCNNAVYLVKHDVTENDSDVPDATDFNNIDCFPIPGGGEACDGLDNNCDGLIDETFDFNTDTNNCGGCNIVCDFPGAYANCIDGNCVMGECAPGFVDLNENPSDGCEYKCYPTNDGSEICDGLDNDCNGYVDDGDSLNNDINNCGACGVICAYNNADATCIEGHCEMVDCNDNFHDINGLSQDGCEYYCEITNGGVEICDGLDNDCDGETDNLAVPPSDDNNCGQCGRVCKFNHRDGTCDATSLDCIPGDCHENFYDLNGLEFDGCEYYCEITNGGVEICDGLDNDCDGLIDEGDPDSGAVCGSTDQGVCSFGTEHCIGGNLVCVGNVEPSPEVCDGLDNDCDGTADNGDPEGGSSCGTTDVGECELGIEHCINGVLVCMGEIGPSPEICDGLDNDCDGITDLEGCYYISSGDIRVDAATSEGAYNSINPDAAADGSVVYTVWTDARSSADIYFSRSTDAGQTFETEIALENSSADAMHPRLLVDKSSSTHYLYIYWEQFVNSQRDIFIAVSNDYGENISSPVRVTSSSLDSIRSELTVDSSEILYLVREDYREQSGNDTPYRNIYLNVSSDHGSNWSGDRRVNNDLAVDASFALKPKISVGKNNRIFVVWQDYRNGKPDIYLNYSDDKGITWQSSDIRINSSAAGATTCDNPLVISDKNENVYVFFEDFRNGEISSIYLRVSHDNGETWSSSDILLSSGTADAFAVDATVDSDGNLYAVWQDFREGLPQIRFIKSEDQGNSVLFDTNVDPRAGFSSFPKIKVTPDGRPVVIYLDERDGLKDVYVNFSLDNGETFQTFDLRMDQGSAAGTGTSLGVKAVLTGEAENIPGAVWFDSRYDGLNSDIYFKALNTTP